MSVIIDGMDQAKTNLPHFTTVRKCGHGLWRLRYDVRVNLYSFVPHVHIQFDVESICVSSYVSECL